MGDSWVVGVLADHSHLGDPVAMEQLADELVRRAESVGVLTTTLARHGAGITFEGPAAERLREDLERRRKSAHHAAGRLQAAAQTLRRSAAVVGEQIYELERAEERRQARESE